MIGLVKKCKTPNCNRVSRAKGVCWRCYNKYRNDFERKKKEAQRGVVA